MGRKVPDWYNSHIIRRIEVSLNLCYYKNNEESPDVTVSLLTF